MILRHDTRKLSVIKLYNTIVTSGNPKEHVSGRDVKTGRIFCVEFPHLFFRYIHKITPGYLKKGASPAE